MPHLVQHTVSAGHQRLRYVCRIGSKRSTDRGGIRYRLFLCLPGFGQGWNQLASPAVQDTDGNEIRLGLQRHAAYLIGCVAEFGELFAHRGKGTFGIGCCLVWIDKMAREMLCRVAIGNREAIRCFRYEQVEQDASLGTERTEKFGIEVAVEGSGFPVIGSRFSG